MTIDEQQDLETKSMSWLDVSSTERSSPVIARLRDADRITTLLRNLLEGNPAAGRV